MEKFESLYGLYVACEEGQHEDYMILKTNLEKQLKQAVQKVKEYGHEGFDVGFILFSNNQSVLSCCIDSQQLWIGLYDRKTKEIQRYVVFNDVKDLTDENIARFANIIENIAKKPSAFLQTNNLATAWQKELENIRAEEEEPDYTRFRHR